MLQIRNLKTHSIPKNKKKKINEFKKISIFKKNFYK